MILAADVHHMKERWYELAGKSRIFKNYFKASSSLLSSAI